MRWGEGGEEDLGRVEVRFVSVSFQYNGVEISVYRHYIISIMEYLGCMEARCT